MNNPLRSVRVVCGSLRSRFWSNTDSIAIEGFAPYEALQTGEPPKGAAIWVNP
jgi:hypothetical protein